MQKIRDFSRRSPVWFGAGFTLLVILVHELVSQIFYLLPSSTTADILLEVAFLIWPTALVLLFGFGYIYRKKGFWSAMGAGMFKMAPFFLTVIFKLIQTLLDPATPWKSGAEILLGVLMLIAVGYREEVFYRGVITNAIARKYADSARGIWITVLSSSALFGAMHMGNVLHGASFQSALIQSFSAIGTGAFFCAVYLRSGSIWGVAWLHTLVNAAGAFEALFTNSGGDLADVVNSLSGYGLVETIITVFDFIIVAFLLRKSKRQRILDRIQKLNEELI